jgi:hypothetical protein
MMTDGETTTQRKNTSVIFVLRDGKPRSILKISYIQDNMREMWKRIYHKDVVSHMTFHTLAVSAAGC